MQSVGVSNGFRAGPPGPAPLDRDRTFLQALEARVTCEDLRTRSLREPDDLRLKRITARAERRYLRRLRRLLDE